MSSYFKKRTFESMRCSQNSWTCSNQEPYPTAGAESDTCDLGEMQHVLQQPHTYISHSWSDGKTPGTFLGSSWSWENGGTGSRTPPGLWGFWPCRSPGNEPQVFFGKLFFMMSWQHKDDTSTFLPKSNLESDYSNQECVYFDLESETV